MNAPSATSSPSIRLQVNGVSQCLEALPRRPLLGVLRHELGLKGTRFGCGEGRCGACVVLVDGQPQHSCTTSLADAEHRSVITVEGLMQQGRLAPVQALFLEGQAAQCGYCINGIMLSLTGLLARRPLPGREEILQFLDERHLCRCGAHARIVRVVDRLLASTAP